MPEGMEQFLVLGNFSPTSQLQGSWGDTGEKAGWKKWPCAGTVLLSSLFPCRPLALSFGLVGAPQRGKPQI